MESQHWLMINKCTPGQVKLDTCTFGIYSVFRIFLWPPGNVDGGKRVGRPAPSFIFSCRAVPYKCKDCDDVVQTTCKECCLENDATSSANASDGALDWACDVVTDAGWDVAEEEGGVVGPTLGERRGENLGETLEWGDDGALTE